MRLLLVGFMMSLMFGGTAATASEALDEGVAARFARLALDCVHREYPNKIAHVLTSDEDVQRPRDLTPVFYGCFDWHSAVHAHWLLVRLVHLMPDAAFAEEARRKLDRSFTEDKVLGELVYLAGDGRDSFERPYGRAWLLQLMAELRQWQTKEAKRWRDTLMPLEEVIARPVKTWLPKLSYPIRSGTHNQTAFAFGLFLDWARLAGDAEMEALVAARSRDFYLGDRDCPLNYEPSGEDFLSPCLMEADLMRRVLPAAEFRAWLAAFLPHIPTEDGPGWLDVGIVTDPTDGKIVHLDGLNLSRAWALEGIASALEETDPRRDVLMAAARRHATSGLASVSGEHYAGGHWLASFATYLVTRRGIKNDGT